MCRYARPSAVSLAYTILSRGDGRTAERTTDQLKSCRLIHLIGGKVVNNVSKWLPLRKQPHGISFNVQMEPNERRDIVMFEARPNKGLSSKRLNHHSS